MKKLIIIPFLIINIILFGQNTYYVQPVSENPNASDSNTGTDIDYPWATWGKALTSTSVQPGDYVYFRDGIYPMSVTTGYGYIPTRSGTATDTIHYFAYSGEIPILDCDDVDPVGTKNYAIVKNDGNSINYVHFRGLIVRNVWQVYSNVEAQGIYIVKGTGLVFENCITYNIHGGGFYSSTQDGGDHYYTNCDAYNCCDSLSVSPKLPGNSGTGFVASNMYNTTGHVYYTDCRAWNCGDQGFSISGEQYIEADGCWSFRNGQLQGEGHGYKLGWAYLVSGSLRRVVKNCIAAYNRTSGFTTNDSDNKPDAIIYMHIYNNTAYHNGYYAGWTLPSYGVYIYNTDASDEAELERIFKNNIFYYNEDGAVFLQSGASYTHSNNSWDNPPGITLTDADFLSIDSTGITAARQADGSLPDNDCYNKFLRLSSTSQAIGVGIDIGLTYDAAGNLWLDPPSIGAYEYYTQGTPEPPAVLSEVTTFMPHWQTSTTAISGGNVFDDGGADVTARGVCWSTSPLPTTADDHTSDGTGTGVFYSEMTGLNQNWVYYVRAYATNEVGTAYGNQMTFRINQIFMINGKPLRLPDGRIEIIQ